MAKLTMKTWGCDKCGERIRNKFATYVEHTCKKTKTVRPMKVIEEDD